MPQAKKKATAKAVKPKSSGTRKSPLAMPAGQRVASPAVKSPGASKKTANKGTPGNRPVSKKASKKGTTVKKTPSKKATSKKPASKKANASSNSAATVKKIAADRVIEATAATKPEVVKKASETAAMGYGSVTTKSVVKHKPGHSQEEEKISKSNKSKDFVELGQPKPDAANADAKRTGKQSSTKKQPEAAGMPAKAKTRKHDLALSDPAGQGPGKPGQKKRGWRDIEALTERARLKSLLSDIWHEDIDLDSDIFGETDHLFGYYTDKEEVIEAGPEEVEEWEEFEEEEG